MAVTPESELCPVLMDYFTRRTGTAVMATIDADYHPHTAPFHYMTVVDAKHLLMAISLTTQTYRNIVENNYVALSLLDEGDLAFCIKGFGKVLLEQMIFERQLAIIEVEIIEIRKNNWESHHVTQGIRIAHKNEIYLINSRKIFQELVKNAIEYSG